MTEPKWYHKYGWPSFPWFGKTIDYVFAMRRHLPPWPKRRVEITGLEIGLPDPSFGYNKREEYLSFALDKVTQSLISSGRLHPSNKHLINSSDLVEILNEFVEWKTPEKIKNANPYTGEFVKQKKVTWLDDQSGKHRRSPEDEDSDDEDSDDEDSDDEDSDDEDSDEDEYFIVRISSRSKKPRKILKKSNKSVSKPNSPAPTEVKRRINPTRLPPLPPEATNRHIKRRIKKKKPSTQSTLSKEKAL